MDGSLELIQNGLAMAFHPVGLLFSTIGVVLGIAFGAMPGLSAVTALAVLLPITFTMSAEQAILLFVGVYVGSQFGNSLPSILIHTPGTPASVLTAIEGRPFQERGQGAKALGVALVASTAGQFLSFVLVALLLLPLAELSVRLLQPEIFALALFGLMAAAGLVSRDPVKGLVATVFGLMLSTVGPDPVGGRARFGFGVLELQVGLQPVPVIIGLLVVAELIGQASGRSRRAGSRPAGLVNDNRVLPSLGDLRCISRVTGISSLVGFVMGMIPGIGASAGSFIAYQQARTFAHDPSTFGGEKGSIEGLAAADAANNASTGGEFIPTLGLGIPGGPAMVLVMAALLLHGITPGPGLFRSNPGTLEATIGGLFVAMLLMAVIGYFVIRPSVYLVSLSREAVTVVALLTSLVGVFSLRWNIFDVYVALGLGLIGYVMQRFDYPMAPAALGFILGRVIESSLRRGLVISFNDPVTFVTRPVVLALLVLGVGLFAYSIWSKMRGGGRAGAIARSDVGDQP